MKICVISDLHCKHDPEPNNTSECLLISNKPRSPISRHPIASLLHLIEKQEIDADILICPGDLGDRADEQGIISSWGFLEEIKQKIKARLLIGLPGNHDVKSRGLDPTEAFTFIKTFHDRFPFADESLKVKFWENGYCILPFENTLFLLLNTVHDHLTPTAANQSSLTSNILEKIEIDFSKLDLDKNGLHKIAVLHHHPIQHSNVNNWNKDTDLVSKGDELVSLLDKFGFQLLIHGHKHQPRILEMNSLTILACGSFASIANLQATGIQNMFHILELNESIPKGHIYSWEYNLIDGWSQKLNEKFPPKIGFGSKESVEKIAEKINDTFIAGGRKTMLYEDIADGETEIQYLIPDKLVKLNRILKSSYGIKMTPEFPLEPSKVSKLLK